MAWTHGKYEDGNIYFYKGTERINPIAPVVVDEDFTGYALSATDWGKTETVGAVALVGSGTNGVVSCAITNADSAQIAALHFGDNLNLSMKNGLVMEFRATFAILPTTGTETVQAVMGLASAHNATLDTVATNTWFRVESTAQTALLWECDDGNTDDDDNSCATTLVASTYNIYRIDCRDLVNGVKFYVDGNLVGTSGDMNTNLTAGEAKVQPYFNVSKAKSAANTGTGTLYIDYVRIYQNRS